MKYILILLMLVSCEKEVQPRCGYLTYVATTYNEKWQITEELVTDFGQVCDKDFEYYQAAVKGQPAIGNRLCLPGQYGKWVLK